MSKGNLFLGLASGKIGSVVLYRAFGEERARSWVSRKRNPRTATQAVQRAVMKTCQVSYSSLMPLCRQSFQGCAEGTPCQAAFVSRNARMLRSMVADDIAGGPQSILESAKGNFCRKGDYLPPYNPLIVSDGGLPEITGVGRQGAVFLPDGLLSPAASYTYAQICAAYGISRGDELHVVCAAVDPVTGIMSSVLHSCIIMEPASGDMSTPFVLERGGAINSPNAGNYGDDVTCYWLSDEDEPSASFRFQYVDRFSGEQHIAGAIVRAHQAGSLKQWSPAVLKTVDDVANVAPLGAAVATYMGNSVYLNGI